MSENTCANMSNLCVLSVDTFEYQNGVYPVSVALLYPVADTVADTVEYIPYQATLIAPLAGMADLVSPYHGYTYNQEGEYHLDTLEGVAGTIVTLIGDAPLVVFNKEWHEKVWYGHSNQGSTLQTIIKERGICAMERFMALLDTRRYVSLKQALDTANPDMTIVNQTHPDFTRSKAEATLAVYKAILEMEQFNAEN